MSWSQTSEQMNRIDLGCAAFQVHGWGRQKGSHRKWSPPHHTSSPPLRLPARGVVPACPACLYGEAPGAFGIAYWRPR